MKGFPSPVAQNKQYCSSWPRGDLCRESCLDSLERWQHEGPLEGLLRNANTPNGILSYRLSLHRKTNILTRTWQKTLQFDYFHRFIVKPLRNKTIIYGCVVELNQVSFLTHAFQDPPLCSSISCARGNSTDLFFRCISALPYSHFVRNLSTQMQFTFPTCLSPRCYTPSSFIPPLFPTPFCTFFLSFVYTLFPPCYLPCSAICGFFLVQTAALFTLRIFGAQIN